MKIPLIALVALSALLLTVCAGRQPAAAEENGPPGFRHDVESAQKPWTHSDFDAAGDKFTFAVFSDLTGGERAGVFEVAVEQLRLLRPELILSVGDLIEGGTTDRAQLAREWLAAFKSS